MSRLDHILGGDRCKAGGGKVSLHGGNIALYGAPGCTG
jgi:hypothetical protein